MSWKYSTQSSNIVHGVPVVDYRMVWNNNRVGLGRMQEDRHGEIRCDVSYVTHILALRQ